jgi:two-component system, NtrC family, response regulator AtoC
MKILLVDDEKPIRDMLASFLNDLKYEVESAGTVAEGLEKAWSFKPDTILLDVNLPDGTGLDFLRRFQEGKGEASVVLITANVDVKVAVEAIKRGAEDYLAKPLNLDELEIILKKLNEKRGMRRDLAALKAHQKAVYQRDYLFLSNPAMQKVYEQIEQVAEQASVTVLITGETGTGKEHAAKLIHVLSSRTAAPFLELHCGAMPETLMEAELFGYEQGAFTDARRSKPGLFEVANGGTVFLDEIGELPMTVQTKLLKVLEQKTIRRLGGIQENKINVRVVAATNRDLKQEVNEGRFRADLFYRLNVVNIVLPPLTSRPEDVEGLARFFFSDFSKEFNKKLRPLSDELLKALKNYHWPGNVRELKNAMERAVLTTMGQALTLKDFPPEIFDPVVKPKTAGAVKTALNREDAEKENIRQTLLTFKGHKTKAAEYLGVSRTTLLSKIKKYHLK